MNNRKLFFDVLKHKTVQIPFIPDLTSWYLYRRMEPGHAQPYWAGEFIPDDADIHGHKGTMPEEYKSYTLMDFYRRFDLGAHFHIYHWLQPHYVSGVESETLTTDTESIHRFHTPKGMIQKRMLLASDGSWSPHEFYIKKVEDLDILQYVVESQTFSINTRLIKDTLDGVGQQGQADIVLPRSPFGKLVHEYVGFENTVYYLFDNKERIFDFLAVQRERDLEVVRLAAETVAKLVIISDHADETLVSPPQYEHYCIPFYQEATAILHRAGKYVSTHLDGNFKGFFGLLDKTGFDYLDGCTPSPMFNYTPAELAEAMPPYMTAFCGIPATLFCQRLQDEELIRAAQEIIDALRGRLFLNVGDILPANGDIQQVLKIAEYVANSNKSLL